MITSKKCLCQTYKCTATACVPLGDCGLAARSLLQESVRHACHRFLYSSAHRQAVASPPVALAAQTATVDFAKRAAAASHSSKDAATARTMRAASRQGGCTICASAWGAAAGERESGRRQHCWGGAGEQQCEMLPINWLLLLTSSAFTLTCHWHNQSVAQTNRHQAQLQRAAPMHALLPAAHQLSVCQEKEKNPQAAALHCILCSRQTEAEHAEEGAGAFRSAGGSTGYGVVAGWCTPGLSDKGGRS